MSFSFDQISEILGENLIKSVSAGLSTFAGRQCTVTSSTQAVNSDSLFVAIKGSAGDGHSYVQEAYSKGAVACVVEDEKVLSSNPGFVVSDTKLALSALASAQYNHPSERLLMFGVTGTNGKSTTAWILANLLTAMKLPSMLIGTLGIYKRGIFDEESDLTTPDPGSIHFRLSQAVNEGLKSAAMEVSSHALDQKRCEHVNFDVGIFTNLTRDHLDYHQTYDQYFLAKRKLFELLENSGKKTRAAVINADDEYGRMLLKDRFNIRYITFGKESLGYAPGIEHFELQSVATLPGMQSEIVFNFKDKSYSVISPFIGEFNAYNLLGSICALYATGLSLEEIIQKVPSLPFVPGRLEMINWYGRSVFVDYSHTPDSLERALIELRKISSAELWVIFGCGGDRDKGKRPIMGSIAASHADKVVVTSDNPRTEDPNSIINDILSSGIIPHIQEADRKLAIEKTLKNSKEGDIILLAGKGHEDYQIIGKEKLPFSDQEIVRNYKI